MKLFIINLPDSKNRRENMRTVLKNTQLDWDFFEAFDGRNITDKQKNTVYDASKAKNNVGREMSGGEIGCAISHRNVYKYMIDNNIPEAVILEDDVVLSDSFKETVIAISELCLKNTIVKLEDRCENLRTSVWNIIRLPNGSVLGKLVDRKAFGAYGYYLDKTAAASLLSLSDKVINVSDHWYFYKRYINVFNLNPSIVSIDPQYHSDIWAHETTSAVRNTRKKYPKGINFLVRNFKKIDFSFFRQFLP